MRASRSLSNPTNLEAEVSEDTLVYDDYAAAGNRDDGGLGLAVVAGVVMLCVVAFAAIMQMAQGPGDIAVPYAARQEAGQMAGVPTPVMVPVTTPASVEVVYRRTQDAASFEKAPAGQTCWLLVGGFTYRLPVPADQGIVDYSPINPAAPEPGECTIEDVVARP